MKILCVCCNGIGTSMLLKINAEQVAADLGADAEVSTSDIGTAKGSAASSDLILTSQELAGDLEGVSTPVEVIHNFMDAEEIKGVLQRYV